MAPAAHGPAVAYAGEGTPRGSRVDGRALRLQVAPPVGGVRMARRAQAQPSLTLAKPPRELACEGAFCRPGAPRRVSGGAGGAQAQPSLTLAKATRRSQVWRESRPAVSRQPPARPVQRSVRPGGPGAARRSRRSRGCHRRPCYGSRTSEAAGVRPDDSRHARPARAETERAPCSDSSVRRYGQASRPRRGLILAVA